MGGDVSNVEDMAHMFFDTRYFNRPIGNWDVGNVKNMESMFAGTIFNQRIGNWDVGNVKNMQGMFDKSNFNQPIGNWDVSNVENMGDMFSWSKFNQPIGNWVVSNVTNMKYMFAGSRFNQNINNWVVGRVNMEDMFFDNPKLKLNNLPEWYRQRPLKFSGNLPYLHEKVKLQVVRNVDPVTLENIPNCFDLINLEYVNTTGFINEDTSDNIGFVFGTGANANTTCMKRSNLKTMLSDPEGNNLNYKCRGEGYEDWLEDIYTSQTYFRLMLNDKGGVFVPVEYIINVNRKHCL